MGSCMAYIRSYPMDGSCDQEAIFGQCPCVTAVGCVEMLNANMKDMKAYASELVPYALAMLDACQAHINTDAVSKPVVTGELDAPSGADGLGLMTQDPRLNTLMEMKEPGGSIASSPHSLLPLPSSPFHLLPPSEYGHLMRFLWWTTRYAFSLDAHYQPQHEHDPTLRLPSESELEIEQLEAFKGKDGAKADALMSIVTPRRPLWTYTAQLPSEWYCVKYHEAGFCLDDLTKYVHVSVRPLRLSEQLLPDTDDLYHMRAMPQIVKCRFQYEDEQLSMLITEGACEMLQALVHAGAIPHLVNKLQSGHKYMFLFHGLSSGAAIVQPLSLLFHWALARHRQSLPVNLETDIRLGLMVFGAPRVGTEAFAAQFAQANIPADHFIMYTHMNSKVQYYDSVAMHPADLFPIGNQLTLNFYADLNDNSNNNEDNNEDNNDVMLPRVSIVQDLFVRPHLPFNVVTAAEEARLVPDSDMTAFVCLHMFDKYKAFFEKKTCKKWCVDKSILQS